MYLLYMMRLQALDMKAVLYDDILGYIYRIVEVTG
jgi:hypothetical protein